MPASDQDAAALAADTGPHRHIPAGAWDSHMHVFDPTRYPLAAAAVYTPQTHTLADALAFEQSALGIRNLVFVQPSSYGLDNSCLLDALDEIALRLPGARGRGVVAIDPARTSPETLAAWHDKGVRGVRINLQSVGRTDVRAEELRDTLLQFADKVRPLGWVIQVYVPLRLVEMLESVVPELGVRLCIDHMGHPPMSGADVAGGKNESPVDPYALSGFSSLVRLLQGGATYVKLSAPYRMSRRPDDNYSDLDPVAKELLRVAGKSRVVFASDWPHTRFEGLDIKPWVNRVLEWCGDDEELVERLLKENAEDLWDAEA